MQKIRVTGQHTTIQGTGHLAGTVQRFVRMAGCSLRKCPLRKVCDEPFSLNATSGADHPIVDILAQARKEVGSRGWLHITGGEPTDDIEGLTALMVRARILGFQIHLQTHGGNDLPKERADWLTVSPKVGLSELRVTGDERSELIVVFEGQSIDELAALYEATNFKHYFLQPRWDNGSPRGSIVSPIRELYRLGQEWRGAIQAHKYWRCK